MKQLALVLSLLLVLSVFTTAFTHSGGTDSQGGHYDHSTGEYHFHHGMGPHDHPNGVCPYSSTPKATTKPDKSFSSGYNSYSSNESVVTEADKMREIKRKSAEYYSRATPKPTPKPSPTPTPLKRFGNSLSELIGILAATWFIWIPITAEIIASRKKK